MLRAACIFTALAIFGTAAAQSRSPVSGFPGQRAPVPVTRMAVPEAISAPPIVPLTPVQRNQAIQQLTGSSSPAGQTVTLRVDAPVGPNGSYYMNLMAASVRPIVNYARFSGEAGNSFLMLILPDTWSTGGVFVDCAVTPDGQNNFVWRQRVEANNWIEGTTTVVNSHLILATSITGPGQRIDIHNAANGAWILRSCTMTRIG